MRKTKEELEQIKKENKVDTLYSWSRVSSWDNGHYNWYLHYIKNETPDRANCIYGDTGNCAHDVVENLYNNNIKYENMLKEFKDAWAITRDVLGLKFDRNDTEQDNKLANRYYENLLHFFNHHNKVNYDITCEDFAQIKIGNHMLIGYIDAYYKDENDCINIIDWKTSSQYKGENLLKKSGQLVMYGLSFVQKGVPIDKIKLRFNFLKYATITYEQANGKIKSMDVERRLLGEKLQSCSKMWLKKFGYEADEYLTQLIDSNGDISILPIEVQNKISISDCWTEVPFNQEQIDYWTEYVNNTINEIEDVITIYEITDNDELFYDSIEDIAKESYYYAVLSEYSAEKNICYKKYLESLEKSVDIFN